MKSIKSLVCYHIFVLETKFNPTSLYSIKGNIATVLLILFIGFQLIGIVVNTNIQHHRNREQSCNEEHAKKNHYFKLNINQWTEVKIINKNEILLNGKMFDVKSIQFINDQVVIYGHYDSKEDRLLANAKDVNSKKQALQKTFKIAVMFCDEIVEYCIQKTYSFKNNHTQNLISGLLLMNLPTDYPPPRFV